MMEVTLWSKPGCGRCDSAKAKFLLMDIAFNTKDLESSLALHEGWRGDDTEGLLAAWTMLYEAVPLIRIDGKYYDYPKAMRELRERRN